MNYYFLFAFFLVINCFFYFRSLRYLRYFQQEEYNIQRFAFWCWKNRAFDKRATAALVLSFIFMALASPTFIGETLVVMSLFLVIFFEKDPRKSGKLPLKMTNRAVRIHRVASALYSLFIFSLMVITYTLFKTSFLSLLFFSTILFVQVIPFFLCFANLLLANNEKKQQIYFRSLAIKKFKEVAPYTIGITGSYGKTSTKQALGQLLQQSLGLTYWPEKGINTEMGITRSIRNNMQPFSKYAVIEMGAYQKGSIKRLCAFTPPHAAIITVVGSAHLERFGSQETIYQAKSELAKAVPDSGVLVCNGDCVLTRRIAAENPKKQTLLYGFNNEKKELDCWIKEWKITSFGTQFTLVWKGKEYNGEVPQHGKPALSNCVAAFTMAATLGANPEYLVACMYYLKPIDNRLQVDKTNGVTYIRDAYNSNPVGFNSALEVMKVLPGSRKFVMTPGMIELGDEQVKENKEIGEKMAKSSDFAFIVGSENREALYQGVLEGGMNKERVILCGTREEAFAQFAKLQKKEDVLLIENDLPDLFEEKAKF